MGSIAKICQNLQEIMINKAEDVESEFIQRSRQISGKNFSQTLVFGWLNNPHASVENLAQFGMHVGLEISSQGLNKRFTKGAAEFLKALLLDMIEHRVVGESADQPLLKRFSHVYLEDSSIITLNDKLASTWQGCGGNEKASRSALKLQVRLDVNRGELDGPHLAEGRMHDNLASRTFQETFQPKALYLRDLGYWHLSTFKGMGQKGAFWLSYYKTSTLLTVDGEVQSISKLLLNHPEDQLEIDIKLGKNHQLPARLFAQRVPEKMAAKRRRRVKEKYKRQGKTVSKERLTLCDWTILVTNIPSDLLSFEEAMVLIRVRWQIELLFKLWKSHGYIDESKSQNPWRQLCECYAKLIGMVLQHWILTVSVWQFPDRSLTKAAQVIRDFALPLAQAISSLDSLNQQICCLKKSLAKHCRINRSKKSLRNYQLLEQFSGQIC